MKKKLLTIIICVMIFALCGCGLFSKSDSKKDKVSKAEKDIQHALETETESETELEIGTEIGTEIVVEAEIATETNVQEDSKTESTQSTVGNNPASGPDVPKQDTNQQKQETQKQETSKQEATQPEPEAPKQEPSQPENTTQPETQAPAVTPQEPATPKRGEYLVKGDISTISSSDPLKAGKSMYDISITTIDGEVLTLSSLLQEKDVVMLNFWFINCYWCDYEFDFMSTAYLSYKDDVEIIAVDAWDSLMNIQNYVGQKKLPFKVAQCPYSWVTAFNISGCPTSVIIDRYGTIKEVHVGAITSEDGFVSIFERYIGDSYQP